jgi:excisionase family DNA binding protein
LPDAADSKYVPSTGINPLLSSLPLAQAETIYWREVALLRTAERAGDDSAAPTIEQLNEALVARRAEASVVKDDTPANREARPSQGVNRGRVRGILYALLLGAAAALATTQGFSQVGIALAGTAAAVLILTRAVGSKASPEPASVDAEASYATAVGEVLSRGSLGADALAELDVLDRQFIDSMQGNSLPVRLAEREHSRGPLTTSTFGRPSDANADRESAPIVEPETARGPATSPREARASTNSYGAVGAPIRPSVERLYSPKDAAEYLQVQAATVRRWVRLGRLPASRLAGGPHFRIRESDLLNLLDPVERSEGERRPRRSL